MSECARPMPLAEANECCGLLQFYVDGAGDIACREICENCPVLIERQREQFLREAGAH